MQKLSQHRESLLSNLFASGDWGLLPQTPTLLLLLAIASLLSSFLALNVFYYPEKGTILLQ